MIRSKFKIGDILTFLFVLSISVFGSLFFLIRVAKYSYKNEISDTILGYLLFGSVLIISLIFLNSYKYLKINKKKRKLKYYSLFNPFGKTIEFSDFIGMIKVTEITLNGSVDVFYFVNKKGFTQFKINIIHYINADDIKELISLKEIKKYNFGVWLYLKLIFTGKIKVE